MANIPPINHQSHQVNNSHGLDPTTDLQRRIDNFIIGNGRFIIDSMPVPNPALNRRDVPFSVDIQDVKSDPTSILSKLFYFTLGRSFPIICYKGSPGIDAGGVSRDFVSRLFFALKSDLRFPSKQLKERQLLPIIPLKCDEQLRRRLHSCAVIGKIFGAAFIGYKQITIGNHFNSVLFKMIHSLTQEEVSQIPEDFLVRIPDEFNEKLIYLSPRIRVGTNIYLKEWPNMHQVAEKLFIIYLRNMPNLETEQVKKILEDKLDKSLKDTFFVENKEEFIREYFSDVLYAALAIAQGMHVFIGDSDWNKLLRASPESLRERIEGLEVSSEQICQALVCHQEGSTVKEYLERWLKENHENREALQSFLFCLTGSECVFPEMRIIITTYGCSNKLPEWHTCSNQIHLSSHYNDYKTFKKQLEKSMNLALLGSGFQFA